MVDKNVWSRAQKSKNPFDLFKRTAASSDLTAIKDALHQFDTHKHSLPDYMVSSLGSLEDAALQTQLVDYVISQPKVRDLFKSSSAKVDSLVDKLLTLIKQSKDVDSSEIYTRLISHLAFCLAPISDDMLGKLMLTLHRHAFSTQKETLKLQKASLNCISNILNADVVQPLPKPVVDNLADLYRKLKELLL